MAGKHGKKQDFRNLLRGTGNIARHALDLTLGQGGHGKGCKRHQGKAEGKALWRQTQRHGG